MEKENPAQYNYSSFVNNVNITHCYLPHPAPSHISALYLSDCCRGRIRIIVQASGEVANKFGSFLGDFYRSTSSIGEIIYNDPRNVGSMLQRVQNRWHGEFYMLNSENQIVNFEIESADDASCPLGLHWMYKTENRPWTYIGQDIEIICNLSGCKKFRFNYIQGRIMC